MSTSRSAVRTIGFSGIVPAILLAVAVLLCAVPLFAQEKQQAERPKANYDLAEKFSRQNLQKFAYDTSVRPNWIKDTDNFWYTYRNGDGRSYYLVDPEKKTKDFAFDHAKFAASLSEKFKKPYDPKHLPTLTLEFTKDMTAFEFVMQGDSVKYEFNRSTGSIDSVGIQSRRAGAGGRGGAQGRGGRGGRGGGAGGRGWRSYSPDSTMATFSRSYNLYIIGADSVEKQLTFDGEQSYSFGDSSKTRSRASVSWSEDSKRFYVSRRDSRNVLKLYLVNEVAPPERGSDLTYGRPQLVEYNYHMPGDEVVPQSELFTYDVASNDFKKVPVEKWKDQSTRGTRWFNKGSDELFFQRQDRTQDRYEVCRYNVNTGETKVIIEEYIQDSYVETKGASFINDESEIIWWSERSGWGHFYLYDSDGNLKNQITSGPFLASSISRIDTTGRVLYFMGNGREEGEVPYYDHLYRVNFDGSGLQLLGPGDGTHSASISPSNKYFVDNYSRIDKAPVSVLRDTKGNLIMELEETDVSALLEYGWQFPERFTVKADDGVEDIYGVMFKPFDLDPNKKYPIIAHVYPGPQTESVTFSFSPTNGDMSLAQLGFIVIHIGNRGGSPDRSKWYHNYGYGNLRDYGLADKKAGIEQLAARFPFIDAERVGIYGHSGGGFMSTAALVVPPYNDFFDVAVSSSGNHDNNMYNANWSEKHHGIKEVEREQRQQQTTGQRGGRGQRGERGGQQQQQQGERQQRGQRQQQQQQQTEDEVEFEIRVPANHEMAENLKGHLLLVHGTMDNNVHPGNTIRMVDALIKAGKRFDMYMLPGQAHGFRGEHSSFFNKILRDYFCQHLLGDSDKDIDLFDKRNN
ncbi:DPP IV N-terminal domain-containing protein [candidate division KSB1 bacterium]